jgi:hypothetical protein
MAAGKTYKGKNLRIFIDDETIFHSTECSFATSRTFDGIASKDTNGTIQSPGNYEWSINGNQLISDKAALSSQEDTASLLQKFKDATLVEVKFTTDIAGDVVVSGNMYIQSFNMSAPTNGVATGDFSLVGDGDFELGTVAP